MSGTLFVRPTNAKLKWDTELFSEMDCYCQVTCGVYVEKTEVAQDQGKKPNWNKALKFIVNGEQSLKVAIYDKDEVTDDDIIGECQIPLAQVYQMGRSSNWYNLRRSTGYDAGEVMINIEFAPNGGMGMGMGMGMGYQNQMGGPGMGMGMNMGGPGMGMGMNMGGPGMGMGGPGMGMGMNMGGPGMGGPGMGGPGMGMNMGGPGMGGPGMGGPGMGMGMNMGGPGMGGPGMGGPGMGGQGW